MGRLLDIGKPRQRPASGIRHGRDVVIALFSASSADAGVSRSSPSSPQKIRKPSRNVSSRREEAAEESFVFQRFRRPPSSLYVPRIAPDSCQGEGHGPSAGLTPPPGRFLSTRRQPYPRRSRSTSARTLLPVGIPTPEEGRTLGGLVKVCARCFPSCSPTRPVSVCQQRPRRSGHQLARTTGHIQATSHPKTTGTDR